MTNISTSPSYLELVKETPAREVVGYLITEEGLSAVLNILKVRCRGTVLGPHTAALYDDFVDLVTTETRRGTDIRLTSRYSSVMRRLRGDVRAIVWKHRRAPSTHGEPITVGDITAIDAPAAFRPGQYHPPGRRAGLPWLGRSAAAFTNPASSAYRAPSDPDKPGVGNETPDTFYFKRLLGTVRRRKPVDPIPRLAPVPGAAYLLVRKGSFVHPVTGEIKPIWARIAPPRSNASVVDFAQPPSPGRPRYTGQLTSYGYTGPTRPVLPDLDPPGLRTKSVDYGLHMLDSADFVVPPPGFPYTGRVYPLRKPKATVAVRPVRGHVPRPVASVPAGAAAAPAVNPRGPTSARAIGIRNYVDRVDATLRRGRPRGKRDRGAMRRRYNELIAAGAAASKPLPPHLQQQPVDLEPTREHTGCETRDVIAETRRGSQNPGPLAAFWGSLGAWRAVPVVAAAWVGGAWLVPRVPAARNAASHVYERLADGAADDAAAFGRPTADRWRLIAGGWRALRTMPGYGIEPVAAQLAALAQHTAAASALDAGCARQEFDAAMRRFNEDRVRDDRGADSDDDGTEPTHERAGIAPRDAIARTKRDSRQPGPHADEDRPGPGLRGLILAPSYSGKSVYADLTRGSASFRCFDGDEVFRGNFPPGAWWSDGVERVRVQDAWVAAALAHGGVVALAVEPSAVPSPSDVLAIVAPPLSTLLYHRAQRRASQPWRVEPDFSTVCQHRSRLLAYAADNFLPVYDEFGDALARDMTARARLNSAGVPALGAALYDAAAAAAARAHNALMHALNGNGILGSLFGRATAVLAGVGEFAARLPAVSYGAARYASFVVLGASVVAGAVILIIALPELDVDPDQSAEPASGREYASPPAYGADLASVLQAGFVSSRQCYARGVVGSFRLAFRLAFRGQAIARSLRVDSLFARFGQVAYYQTASGHLAEMGDQRVVVPRYLRPSARSTVRLGPLAFHVHASRRVLNTAHPQVVTYDLRRGSWHVCSPILSAECARFDGPLDGGDAGTARKFGTVLVQQNATDTFLRYENSEEIHSVPTHMVAKAASQYRCAGKVGPYVIATALGAPHKNVAPAVTEAMVNGLSGNETLLPSQGTAGYVDASTCFERSGKPKMLQVHPPILADSLVIPLQSQASLRDSVYRRQRAVQSTSALPAEYAALLEDFVSEFPEATPLNHADVRDYKTRPSQQLEMNQLAFNMFDGRSSIYCFAKAEGVGIGKPQRLITGAHGPNNFTLARWMIALQLAFNRDFSWWAPGKSMPYVQQRIHAIHSAARAAGVGMVEIDFNKLDGSQGAPAIVVMERICLGVFGEITPELRAALAFGQGGIATDASGDPYDVGYGTKSGFDDTTVRNTILCAFVIYCALRQVSEHALAWDRLKDWLLSGDDSSGSLWGGDVAAVAASMGLSADVRPYTGGSTRFLGRFYPAPYDNPSCIADPRRFLRKFHILPMHAGDDPCVAMVQRATGWLICDPRTPFVSEYARAVVRLYGAQSLRAAYHDPWSFAALCSGEIYRCDIPDGPLFGAILKDLDECDPAALIELRAAMEVLAPTFGQAYPSISERDEPAPDGLVLNGVLLGNIPPAPPHEMTDESRELIRLAIAQSRDRVVAAAARRLLPDALAARETAAAESRAARAALADAKAKVPAPTARAAADALSDADDDSRSRALDDAEDMGLARSPAPARDQAPSRAAASAGGAGGRPDVVPCYKCGSEYHQVPNCPRCGQCGEFGHATRNCTAYAQRVLAVTANKPPEEQLRLFTAAFMGEVNAGARAATIVAGAGATAAAPSPRAREAPAQRGADLRSRSRRGKAPRASAPAEDDD